MRMNRKKDDIASRIYQGDKAAEKELCVNYNEIISTIIQHRLGKNNSDWEDVLSETQIAILLSLRAGLFDPEIGNLDSYIYGIVLNQIKHYYNRTVRKKNTYINNLQLENLTNFVDIESEKQNEEIDLLFQNIISKLNHKYKEVLYLRYYQGLSIQEIAFQLGIKPSKVSERIYYAKKLIKKKLKRRKFFPYLK